MDSSKCTKNLITDPEKIYKKIGNLTLPKLLLLTKSKEKSEFTPRTIPPIQTSQLNLKESIYDEKSLNCSGTENIKFDYILTQTNDPNLNNLFTDDDVVIEITDKHFKLPDKEKMNKLRMKLDMIGPINEK